MFDPFDHPGLPVDRHTRHWHELDVQPVDARATDLYTRYRITAMEALEAAAARFDRQLTRRTRDPDARRSVGSLGQSAADRQHHVAALQPRAQSALETAALLHEAKAADVEKKAEIPPPVGAGLVAGGTALLVLASFGRRKKA